MYYLAYHEVEALEKDDRETAVYFLNRQEAFQRTFLDGWVIPFSEKIKGGTENEYYRALADCVSVFILKTDRCAMPEELRENLARV
jgi:TorA maturation chaperone TorD